MFQENIYEQRPGAWCDSTHYYLTPSMIAVSTVLTVFMLGTSLYLERKSQASKSVLYYVELVIVVLACILIIYPTY